MGIKLKNFNIGGISVNFPSDKEKSQRAVSEMARGELERLKDKTSGTGIGVARADENYDILNTGAESKGGSGIYGADVTTMTNPGVGIAEGINEGVDDPTAKLAIEKGISSVDALTSQINAKKAYIAKRIDSVANDPVFGPQIKAIQDNAALTDIERTNQIGELIALHDGAQPSDQTTTDVNNAKTQYNKNNDKFEKKHYDVTPPDGAGGFSIRGKDRFVKPRSALNYTIFSSGETGTGTIIRDEDGKPIFRIPENLSYADIPISIGKTEIETVDEKDFKGQPTGELAFDDEEVFKGYKFENITRGQLSIINHQINQGQITRLEGINMLVDFMKNEILTSDGGVNSKLLGVADTENFLMASAETLLDKDASVRAQMQVQGYEKYKEEMEIDGTADLTFEQYVRNLNLEMGEYVATAKSAADLKNKEKLDFSNEVLATDKYGYFDNASATFNGIVSTYDLDFLNEKLGFNLSEAFEEVLLTGDILQINNFIGVISSEAALAKSNIPKIEGEKFERTTSRNEKIKKTIEGELYEKIAPFLALRNQIKDKRINQTTTINTDSINLYANNTAKSYYSSDEDASKIIATELVGLSSADKKELIKKVHPGSSNTDALIKLYEALGKTDTTGGMVMGIGDTTGLEFATAETPDEPDLDTDVTDELTATDVTTIATVISAQLPQLSALGINPGTYLQSFLQENGIDPKYEQDILSEISYT
jgi:hypothetical protein|tara:strand:+ start:720 stop:2855 length:2136 start_codon:yes stop_codon:yes gene_type:complete